MLICVLVIYDMAWEKVLPNSFNVAEWLFSLHIMQISWEHDLQFVIKVKKQKHPRNQFLMSKYMDADDFVREKSQRKPDL